jgi:hypothetical protein
VADKTNMADVIFGQQQKKSFVNFGENFKSRNYLHLHTHMNRQLSRVQVILIEIGSDAKWLTLPD